MHEEDALKYLIAGLRKGDSYHTSGYSSYGYDLYLPNLMREFAAEELAQAARNPQGQETIERRIRVLSPPIFRGGMGTLPPRYHQTRRPNVGGSEY